jgi:hypothetical protein
VRDRTSGEGNDVKKTVQVRVDTRRTVRTLTREEKQRRAIEKAADAFAKYYAPAMKELEKH